MQYKDGELYDKGIVEGQDCIVNHKMSINYEQFSKEFGADLTQESKKIKEWEAKEQERESRYD